VDWQTANIFVEDPDEFPSQFSGLKSIHPRHTLVGNLAQHINIVFWMFSSETGGHCQKKSKQKTLDIDYFFHKQNQTMLFSILTCCSQ